MKRFVFLSWLQLQFERRQTASCASARLRNVLASDRAFVRCDATRKIASEMREVLLRYFAVDNLCFRIAEGKNSGSMHYVLEADLTI